MSSEAGMSGEPGAARPEHAVAAALVIRGARVLVQTRPEGRSWPGWWEFPGGKVEAGESVLACAERECLEELGLPVRALAPLHAVRWETPGALVHVTFVLCEPHAESDEPRPLEGQRLQWASAEELPALTFLPANASLLPLLDARLRRAGR
jgi:8-oxo-dGTP diphosphatase